jgi:hypothetical protein
MSHVTAQSTPPGVRQAQADVDRIRADLAATVDALVAKTDVTGRAKESAAQLAAEGRHRVEAAGEQVQETFEAARDKLRASPVAEHVDPRTVGIGIASAVLVAVAVFVGRRR